MSKEKVSEGIVKKELLLFAVTMLILAVVNFAHADAISDLFLSIKEETTSSSFEQTAKKLGLKIDSNVKGYYRAAVDKDTVSFVKHPEGKGANIRASYVEVHFAWRGELLNYMYFNQEKMVAGFVDVKKDRSNPSRFHGLGCYIVDYNRNEPGIEYNGYNVSYFPVESVQAIVDYQPTVCKDSFDSLQNVFLMIGHGTEWEEIEKKIKDWGLSCKITASSDYTKTIAFSDNVTLPYIREPGSYISVEVYNGKVLMAYYYDLVVIHRRNIYMEYVTSEYWGKSWLYNYPEEPGFYLVQDNVRTKYDTAEEILTLMNAER